MPGYGRWLLVLCLVAWGCASAPTKENLQSQAVSLNDQGYQYYRQSRFNVAEGKFAEALKLNRLIDRRVGIAANLNNLGVIAQEQDNPKQAMVYFQEALEINRELHDPAGLSETLNNLGLVQLSQGRVHEAQTAYLEALDQARLLPPGPLLALSLTHLGDVARVRRDYDLALSYYHQALRVDEDRKDARGRALRWERLGRTFLDLKDYARADLYLHDALREFRRLEDTDGLADTLKDLTRLALAQGDKPAAALNGQLLLEIYQARGQEQEAAKLEELLKAGRRRTGHRAACGRRISAKNSKLETRNSSMDIFLHWIKHVIKTYGYLGVFGSQMLGMFGLPVPDETILTFTGFLIFQRLPAPGAGLPGRLPGQHRRHYPELPGGTLHRLSFAAKIRLLPAPHRREDRPGPPMVWALRQHSSVWGLFPSRACAT